MTEQLLIGGRVVTPNEVLDDGWVYVADGRIAALGTGQAPDCSHQLDLAGSWLLPGFIDIHMHGGGGHDATESPSAMADSVAFHHRHGTTRTLVSLVAAPLDNLVEQLGWAADLAADQTATWNVIGAHLEGPFLSHARCGAQNPKYLQTPDRAILATLSVAARGKLRTITIAPELPGALEVIADAAALGVVVAVGHTDATYEEANAGIAAGATLATHLFNGMPPLHHREPGVIGAALDSGIPCELINDGVHIHPSIIRLVAHNPHRPILITDATAAAGMPDGDFLLGGDQVRVRAGQVRLAANGVLAGSSLTMDAALRRAVLDCGLSIGEASAAASGNPARALGIGHDCGVIAPGTAAELVVLDEDFRVTGVLANNLWSHD